MILSVTLRYPPGLLRRSTTSDSTPASSRSTRCSSNKAVASLANMSSWMKPMLSSTIRLATKGSTTSAVASVKYVSTPSRRTTIVADSPRKSRESKSNSPLQGCSETVLPYWTITSPTTRPAASAGLPGYTSVIVKRQESLGVEHGFPSDPHRAYSIPIPALELPASNRLKNFLVSVGCSSLVFSSSRDSSIASTAASAAARLSATRSISAHTTSNSGAGNAQGGG